MGEVMEQLEFHALLMKEAEINLNMYLPMTQKLYS